MNVLKSFAIAGAVFFTVYTPQLQAEAGKEFDGFPAVRAEVLNLVGGATTRVRVVTDFLSDGELVTGLYIAQYRKVNVQVLLGQARATNVLSRLNYLKAQNVPVWLRPRGFMPQHPTVLLIDDKLYTLNADLDSMAKHRRFILNLQPASEVAKFAELFDTATSTGVSPTPRSTPLVGRAGSHPRNQRVYNPDSNSSSTGNLSQHGGSDASDNQAGGKAEAYRYNRVKEKPTHGIPTKLPKTTIWQDREKNRNADHHE